MLLFNSFKRRNRACFYELLNEQCEMTLEGIKTLHEFCFTGDYETSEKVIHIEKQGDMKRKLLIDEINNTFVTPLEKEDIYDISGTIDDILDYARTTVEEMRAYNIKPNGDVKAMVGILVEIAIALKKAVENLEAHKDISNEEAVKAKKLENTMEQLYRSAVANLFKCNDLKYILKNREIYRHLNNAADKGDRAADILCNIIVKNS